VLVDNVEVPGGAIPIVAHAGVRHVHVVLGGGLGTGGSGLGLGAGE